MGRGTIGFYSGTAGGSQPYSEKYHVVSKELTKDKADPDIYNGSTGYFKNPTATTIEKAIQNDRIYIDGKRQEGKVTYVMDSKGDIIIGKRMNPNDNSSGHYRPNIQSLPKVQKTLQELCNKHPDLFDPSSEWRK